MIHTIIDDEFNPGLNIVTLGVNRLADLAANQVVFIVLSSGDQQIGKKLTIIE
jgi:hypothetical protein